MNVQDFSYEVVQNLPHPEGYQFVDPLTLTILLAIVSAVVEHLVMKCLDRVDTGAIRNPGMFHRIALKRQVAAEFRSRGPHLTEQYSGPIYDGILARAASKSDDHIKMIVGSVA